MGITAPEGADGASHGGRVVQTAQRLGVRPEDILDFSNNAESAAAELTGRIVAATPYPYAYYPDSDSAELRAAIARREGVDVAQVLVGNGSSELIYLALAAFAPRRALLVAPLFSEYATGCARLGIDYALYPLSETQHFRLRERDADRLAAADFDLLILCSPNNPGSVVYQGLGALFTGLKRTARRRDRPIAVLFDAAYREFLYGGPEYDTHAFTALQAAAGEELRLVALLSFTKYFYCPGVRLGYALGDAASVAAMRRRQPPWMVPRFAELLGLRFLEEIEAYREVHRDLPARRAQFTVELGSCDCFAKVHPADLNFVLAKLRPGLSGATVYETLANQRILARVCDNIPGMPLGFLRLQVKSAAENAALLEALRAL